VTALRAALMSVLGPGAEIKSVSNAMTSAPSNHSVRSVMEVTSTPSLAGGIIDGHLVGLNHNAACA